MNADMSNQRYYNLVKFVFLLQTTNSHMKLEDHVSQDRCQQH